MTSDHAVRFQFVVQCHGGGFYLFERDGSLPFQPMPGIMLKRIPGIPSVCGPHSGIDNIIIRVIYDGELQKFLVLLANHRDATRTPEEVLDNLLAGDPPWRLVRRVDHVVDMDNLEGDLTNG